MTWLHKNRAGKDEANTYATKDDLYRILLEDMARLYQLAYLLTGDHEKAEQCFVAGIEEEVPVNKAFRDWARTWAKRTVIQNAVRALRPQPVPADSSSPATAFAGKATLSNVRAGHFVLESVLTLPGFERFVFVMSVLERYSDDDCALLLDCSLEDVRDARLRTLERIASAVRSAMWKTKHSDEGSPVANDHQDPEWEFDAQGHLVLRK
jgi:DNA-directed RNA polymerase specialized sigma24 family protein